MAEVDITTQDASRQVCISPSRLIVAVLAKSHVSQELSKLRTALEIRMTELITLKNRVRAYSSTLRVRPILLIIMLFIDRLSQQI